MSVAGWVWFYAVLSAGLTAAVSAALLTTVAVSANWFSALRAGFAKASRVLLAPLAAFRSVSARLAKISVAVGVLIAAGAAAAQAQTAPEAAGGEANLTLPDLSKVDFLGIDGHKLLMLGLIFCVLGLIFGLTIFVRLKNLPVHRSMLRNFRADLRDLQDLPHHPGQVPAAARELHRRHHRALFRRPAALRSGARRASSSCSACWGSPAATAWPGSAFA